VWSKVRNGAHPDREGSVDRLTEGRLTEGRCTDRLTEGRCRLPVARSPVPDLLFEDARAARLAEIAPLLARPEAVDAGTPIHRITVFLTWRCNLACPHCKSIARCPEDLAARPEKRLGYDLAAFERLLAAHDGTPIRLVQFTGGEASLVGDLPAMIRAARARGARTSVTTNGTLPASRYLALVDAGLDELRISIDAADAAEGAALTGRAGAWEAQLGTLRALAAARERGARFFLVVNTVVGLRNRRRVPELVRFLLRHGPDDLKLITEVEARGGLADFPEVERVRDELRAICAGLPAGRFPLLRLKVRTVFAPDAIGLEGEPPPPAGRWRCLIPLTERTLDRAFYWPCSVYAREGGAPLGPVRDPPSVQRERSARFVREGDCLADPICRRYCLHCTRAFNALANGVGR
jgi:MoaA/NifB/PqqE/SkfB family radical SAM enzyme